MNLNQLHRIVKPVYVNLIAVFSYYLFRKYGDFLQTDWNNYVFYFLLFVLPVFTFVWVFLRFRKMPVKKSNYNAFLISAVPGFPIGVFLGYGFWEMAHGSSILYLILAIVLYGLIGSLLTGILGFCLNFILRKRQS